MLICLLRTVCCLFFDLLCYSVTDSDIVLLGVFWIKTSYKFDKNDSFAGKTIKVVFWNTARIRKHLSESLIKVVGDRS